MIKSGRGMAGRKDQQRIRCQSVKADHLLGKSMTGVRRETAVFGQMKEPENVVATNPRIEHAEDQNGTRQNIKGQMSQSCEVISQ